MKKKVMSLLTAAVLAFSLAACGGAADKAVETAATETSAEKEEAAAEASSEETATEDNAAAEESSEPAADTTAATEGVQADEAFYSKADLSKLSGKKIGITIQSLQNAYWAGVMSALEDVLTENGAEYTIVACDDNSATQIGQVENFISSGCDLIMIHPSDANAVEDVAKEARDAGIKVMCWDDPMENTDANWILDNTSLGVEIGKMCAEFINEKYTEESPAEVILIGYPQTKILLERANGIKEGLEDAAGKYEIVSEQAGLEPNEAQTAVETALQAHPDAKVVTGIGAGPMIGANEALVTYCQTAYSGEVPDEMGVFTTDVTKQQLNQLLDDSQASKGIIGFEGSDFDTATACASMYALILSDEVGSHNVFRGFTKMDSNNAEAILSEMK
ncbi:sugar ABC transporter substrate-binding protein [Butyrivibrio sp. JL13D10]|uniref:sugar ABC transporter substrate-binding protein n=1 Tax=Butyrivibrio sp. JL13D10 TaxID=3236815 RepID=UPI0038B573E0